MAGPRLSYKMITLMKTNAIVGGRTKEIDFVGLHILIFEEIIGQTDIKWYLKKYSNQPIIYKNQFKQDF